MAEFTITNFTEHILEDSRLLSKASSLTDYLGHRKTWKFRRKEIIMNHTQSTYTVAEFFSGCGGFSHGFSRTERFQVVFGNDIKEFALKTFKLNHSQNGIIPITLNKDIRLVTDDELVKMFENQGIGVGKLDCMLGVPPCQGFSQMRRSETRQNSKIARFGGYNKLDEDPRNDLVLRFLEIVAALNPKVVVIENVPQFLSHYHNGKKGGIAEQVEEIFNKLEYEITPGVLNAANYGVPQLRERAIIIASRIGKIELPPSSHQSPEIIGEPSQKAWITVSNAISDLPSNAPLQDTLGGKPGGYLEVRANDYTQLVRTSQTFPYNHITRSYRDSVIKIIEQMQQDETWEKASARMREAYEAILVGSTYESENRDDVFKRLVSNGTIVSAFYKKYYSSAYTRLGWNHPALTITANANFLGSGRYTHPTQNRGITMREAARLQSFDDAFTFYTSDEKGKETENIGIGLDMIGEAVPPLLAKAIANTVINYLDKHRESITALDAEQPIPYLVAYSPKLSMSNK
jgi:DNA-cytosine methyltransferase